MPDGPAAPLAGVQLRLAGSVGGATRSVAVADGIAYAAVGARLLPFDLTNPERPEALGDGWQLAGIADAVAIRGTAAYVLHHQGLQWFDLTQPGPQCCGNVVGWGDDMVLHGDYAYLVAYAHDPPMSVLAAYDLGDPLAPKPAWSNTIPGYRPCSQAEAVEGHLLVGCSGRIMVYQLSNPASPEHVGEIPIAGFADFAGDGGRLYVAADTSLTIYDVSDPVAPEAVGSLDVGGGAKLVAVAGSRVAVLTTAGEVHVVDVADPTSPRLIGGVAIPGSSDAPTKDSLALFAEHVVVSAGSAGLQFATVPDSGEPITRDSVPTFLPAGVRVEGDLAYAIAGGRRFLVFDRSVPGKLVLIGEMQLPIAAGDLDTDVAHAYLLAPGYSGSELMVVDTRDPTTPILVGQLELSQEYALVSAMEDGLVVMTGRESIVTVVNARDPADPRELASLPGAVQPVGLAAANGHVFVSDRRSGLRVVSVGDERHPVQVAQLAFSQTGDLAVSGYRLYLLAEPTTAAVEARHVDARPDPAEAPAPCTPPAETRQRLIVLDVSDPAHPTAVGIFGVSRGHPWPSSLDRVAASGDRAYVQFYWGSGEWWRSVEMLEGPDRAGEIPLPAPDMSGMAAVGDSLFVANSAGGLVELRVEEAVVATPTSTATPSITPTPESSPVPTTPVGTWRCWSTDPDANACHSSLQSVDMLTADSGWAVGDAGTVMHFDGASWSDVHVATKQALSSVRFVSGGDGWVVGEGGTILHWDGAGWSDVPSSTSRSLTSIDVLGADNAWAVGAAGTILHWDGRLWTEVSGPALMTLRSVDALKPADVWAVGDAGVIVHYDGANWRSVASPTGEDLQSVNLLDRSHGWAVGTEGAILHWDGESWQRAASGTEADLRSVYAVSDLDAWAVGAGGILLRWDGDAWAETRSPTDQWLYAVDLADDGSGCAVGQEGVILAFDGRSWRVAVDPPRIPESGEVRSLDVLDDEVGWAVGLYGMILRWDGRVWEQATSPTRQWLRAVSTVSASDAWAVGHGGTILHWDGRVWREVDNPAKGTSSAFFGLDMLSEDDGWVVGGDLLLHWDGSTWQQVPTPPDASSFAIDMVGRDMGWTVGSGGQILRWGGATWSRAASPTSLDLSSVSLSRTDDGWAVGPYYGSDGVFLHWDGIAWTEFARRTGRVTAVDMVTANDGWAVGESGLLHWDGQRWTEAEMPVRMTLMAVDMVSAHGGWAAGGPGHILVYEGRPSGASLYLPIGYRGAGNR